MSLKELEDKQAISEVIDTFANLELDVPAQSALFTDDCEVELWMGGTKAMSLSGKENFVQAFSAGIAGAKTSAHLNAQQVIVLDGDTATDTHYCRAAIVNERDGQDLVTENSIRYVDTLVRQADGRWLISRREQHILVSETRPIA